MPLVLCLHFSGACAHCDFVPQGVRSRQRVQGGAGLLYTALGTKHPHCLHTPHGVHMADKPKLRVQHTAPCPAADKTDASEKAKKEHNTLE